jgi:hypothetical protein
MSASVNLLEAGGAAPTARAAECRVRERHPCSLQTSCQPIAARSDKDCLWPAQLRDISSMGVGLVLRRRFERGTGLAVEIPGPDGDVSDTLLAKVVRVATLRDGSWLLGCHFVSELSEDELERLLQLCIPEETEADISTSPSERPIQSRIEELAKASGSMVVPRVQLEGPGNEGLDLSRSVRRFFLKGTWPLRAGSVLRLRIFERDSEASTVTVRVIGCEKGETGWTIRYSFVGSPVEEALPFLSSIRHPSADA